MAGTWLLATVLRGKGDPEVHTIPLEFVEWSGFSLGPLGEGELTAVVGLDTRFAITRSPGGFHVLRSSRGGEPDANSTFAHETDALRQLMLILGGAGRSIHSLPRLGSPAEASGAAAGILIDQTGTGAVRLSWDEGGERHRGTFPEPPLGHLNARKFAQCIGSTLSDLAQALTSPDGGPLSEDVHGSLVGDSLYYSDQTEKPVAYLSVIRDQTVLGYLWANDEDQSAGYIPRASAGDDAFNAGVAWSQRLSEAKARGLTPAHALAELACSVGNARIGRASSPGVRMAESLDVLRALGAE